MKSLGVMLAVFVLAGCGNDPGEPADASVDAPGVPLTPTIAAPANATAHGVYTASLPARAGMHYAWALSGGEIVSAGHAAGILSADRTTNAIEFNSGAVGALTISATETNQVGETSSAGTAIVTVVPVAVAPLITAPVFVTAGASADYVASVAPHPGATYFWEITLGSIVGSASGPSLTFKAPAAASAFSISCIETNAAGDSSAVSQVEVQAITPPPGTLVVSAPASVNGGTAYTASVPTHPGLTTTWTINHGVIISPGGAAGVVSADGQTNQLQFIGGPFAPGTQVQLTATQRDQASAMASGAVSPTLLAPVAITIDVPTLVTTGHTYEASVPTKPGASYFWTVDNGASIVGLGGASGVLSADGKTNTIRFTSGTVGSHNVSVTETDLVGEITLGSRNVIVLALAVTPTITAPASVTSAQQYTARVAARNGFTYTWEVANGAVVSVTSSSGVNTLTFNAGVSGPNAVVTLSCTETNAAGDSSASATFSAAVVP